MWVRGLKLVNTLEHLRTVKSHPMWVRGLKHGETLLLVLPMHVAPYVGAWIETYSPWLLNPIHMSHPMWVRGLKQNIRFLIVTRTGRTLCGCVD